MTSHIRSGAPTVVHSLSPSLMVSLNLSKGLSLSPFGDDSDIPGKLRSRKPSICTRVVPSSILSMDHSGTPSDAPSLKPIPSPSLEESVRQIVEVRSVQVLQLLSIQLENLQGFHQSYIPLCLHIFTYFMPSYFRSG